MMVDLKSGKLVTFYYRERDWAIFEVWEELENRRHGFRSRRDGVPLQDLVRKFAHQRFEPSGYTANPQIRMAKSIVDYIFRWLGVTFISGYEGVDTEARPLNRSKPAAQRSTTATTERAFIAVGTAAPVKNNRHETEADGGGVRELNAAMAHFQSDAPPCQNCGTILVRSGACYRCPSCGESSGCG